LRSLSTAVNPESWKLALRTTYQSGTGITRLRVQETNNIGFFLVLKFYW